jgi:AraC-like DNA-binding protein
MVSLSPSLNLFTILIFLGIIQGFFLSYLFIINKSKISNFILGLFILSLTLIMIEIFLCETAYIMSYLFLVDFSETVNFIFIPLGFLYIYTELENKLPKYWQLHFLFPIIYFLNQLPWHFSGIEVKYNAYISAYHTKLPHIEQYMLAYVDPLKLDQYVLEWIFLIMLLYILITFFYLKKKDDQSFLYFFKKNGTKLYQMKRILINYILIVLAYILASSQYENDSGDYINASLLSIFIYAVSFKVLRNSSFFKDSPKKYEKSLIENKTAELIIKRLDKYLKEEKVYLDSDLSLKSLSELLSVSYHHLSQAINSKLNMSFYDLLASYRIEHAKQLLLDKTLEQYKIDQIAFDSGFNSRSSFTSIFKKISGITPSQFRKNNQKG